MSSCQEESAGIDDPMDSTHAIEDVDRAEDGSSCAEGMVEVANDVGPGETSDIELQDRILTTHSQRSQSPDLGVQLRQSNSTLGLLGTLKDKLVKHSDGVRKLYKMAGPILDVAFRILEAVVVCWELNNMRSQLRYHHPEHQGTCEHRHRRRSMALSSETHLAVAALPLALTGLLVVFHCIKSSGEHPLTRLWRYMHCPEGKDRIESPIFKHFAPNDLRTYEDTPTRVTMQPFTPPSIPSHVRRASTAVGLSRDKQRPREKGLTKRMNIAAKKSEFDTEQEDVGRHPISTGETFRWDDLNLTYGVVPGSRSGKWDHLS